MFFAVFIGSSAATGSADSKNILIEKHVKLSNSQGPDASSSITTEELSQLVFSIHQIEKLKI